MSGYAAIADTDLRKDLRLMSLTMFGYVATVDSDLQKDWLLMSLKKRAILLSQSVIYGKTGGQCHLQ